MRHLFIVVAAAVVLAGCYPIVKEYEWVRNDGDVFVLKWNIDANNKLTLIEKYTASATSSAMIRIPAGTTSIKEYTWFNKCSVVNSENWTCSTSTPSESISMVDGVLTHKYWGENRVYKTKYKLEF